MLVIIIGSEMQDIRNNHFEQLPGTDLPRRFSQATPEWLGDY